MIQKQKQTQEVKNCLRTYSSLQGQACTYWKKSSCNKSTCKYLHTSVACIQQLKITQNQEITIIISKQITLSPQEAGDYIAKNYKKSNKGITVILNKPKAPVDLKNIVRGNATDKKKQAHEISKFLEKLKNLKQKQRQQEKQIQIESIQGEQNKNQSREEINPSQINPDLKSATQKKQQLQQQQLIKSQNKNKHEPEIQLDNFNQIRNIEQVEKEQYKASKIKGILKHTTQSMKQTSNPTSFSSSSLIYESSSPKNANPIIPQKVKSIIMNHEENKKNRKMFTNDELLKIELEHKSQIQSINLEIDQLKKSQDQLQKELILLLSTTNSSASNSKKQGQHKDKTQK